MRLRSPATLLALALAALASASAGAQAQGAIFPVVPIRPGATVIELGFAAAAADQLQVDATVTSPTTGTVAPAPPYEMWASRPPPSHLR